MGIESRRAVGIPLRARQWRNLPHEVGAPALVNPAPYFSVKTACGGDVPGCLRADPPPIWL